MCIYQDVRKNGAFHIGIQKNRAIHILFVEKRGPIIYLAALKKGAIRHAHPYYAIYRKLPPEVQTRREGSRNRQSRPKKWGLQELSWPKKKMGSYFWMVKFYGIWLYSGLFTQSLNKKKKNIPMASIRVFIKVIKHTKMFLCKQSGLTDRCNLMLHFNF